ncbi:MAG: MBL fold metallo-hydrolase [Planctomycetales bacterium]|nr:MBL fold metallo-hydrolase [Planctomycetales bacterium]
MSKLKQPRLAHDALLADIRAARGISDQLHLWWLGQSGFLALWQGRHLLFDPYLSDSLTNKYAATDKPHVRMSERVVEPARLDFVDVVTSSHNHTDHLDAETLGPILQANPEITIVVPAANQAFAAERLRVEPRRLTPVDAGQSFSVAGFTLHAVPAAHETLDRDEQGRHRYLGFVARCGPHTIYHSGDTVRFEGMVDWLRPFEIDIAILPINGRLPERRVSGNLWGREAAELAHDIGARLLIPCHYDMFEFNTVTPDECRSAAAKLEQPLRVLELGERFSWG